MSAEGQDYLYFVHETLNLIEGLHPVAMGVCRGLSSQEVGLGSTIEPFRPSPWARTVGFWTSGEPSSLATARQLRHGRRRMFYIY